MNLDAILTAVAKKRILVIGDVMLDKYVWGDASRLSPEAPVPVVRVDRETAVAGGAANVAFNLAALGARADLFGWVGEDEDGRRLRSLLGGGHVSLLPGAVSPAVPTIVKTRVVCRRQQVCRLDREAEPSVYALTEADLRESLAPAAARADAILLSGSCSPTTARDSSRPPRSAASSRCPAGRKSSRSTPSPAPASTTPASR